MAPTWLNAVGWSWLVVAFMSSGLIVFDIFGRGHRQQMGVMDAVYPVTALYLGPFALLLYWRWGRSARATGQLARSSSAASTRAIPAVPEMAMATADRGLPGPDDRGIDHELFPATANGSHEEVPPVTAAKPRWVTIAIEVSHCGSGCALGDVIAEWTIYALALTVAGQALFAEYIGDYTLALALGIVFQYFAIAPMRGLGVRDGIKAAARADFISLTFFEIGLFGWMALMTFVLFPAPHHLMPNSPAYWFLMQIGMIVGFITAWPANVWLLNRDIKVAM